AAAVAAAILEALAGAAWAEVVAAELFGQLFVAVNDAHAALHFRLGREALAALAHRFEKNGSVRGLVGPWSTAFLHSARDTNMALLVRYDKALSRHDKLLSQTCQNLHF